MTSIKDNMERKLSYDRYLVNHRLSNIFDNWDSNQFFNSRINAAGRIIVPMDRDTMRHVNENCMVFDFVADAFEDLRQRYREKLANGMEKYNSMADLSPDSGYIKAKSLYGEHQNSMISIIFDNYLIPNREKIHGFFDVMDQIMRFIGDFAPNYPILYSSFVGSHLCPIQANGLMISLQEGGHNDDDQRKEMVESPEYLEFTRLAKEYGFVVPKWAPFTLYANLDSNIMLSYAIQYDITDKDNIYREYYDECKDSDIDLLINMIETTYELFMGEYPTVANPEICNGRYISNRGLRNDGHADINPVPFIVDEYWYEKYLKIILAEKNMQVPKKEIDRILKNCHYIHNRYDFDASYSYLQKTMSRLERFY